MTTTTGPRSAHNAPPAEPTAGGPTARPAKLGIVGGGQLARMLLQAATPLGIDARVLVEDDDAPAAQITPHTVIGRPDAATLSAFAGTVDVTTFEHEHLDLALLTDLHALGRILRPSTVTLRATIDKATQRQLLALAGFPVPPAILAHNDAGVRAAVRATGYPAVLKAARGGYDGRGIWFVIDDASLTQVAAALTGPVLVEPLLAIDAELAVLVVRRPSGELRTYPPIRTVQAGGTCRIAEMPAGLPETVTFDAQALAVAVAEHLDAVGVLAVELFLTGGALVINELAARPHNSGHLTIDACVTSQFENHLRACLDWPLGATDLLVPAATMANVLAVDHTADPYPRLPTVLSDDHVHVTLYGKTPRPRRKIGHVTATGADLTTTRAAATHAANQLAAPTPTPIGVA